MASSSHSTPFGASWILALGSLPQVRNRFHRARAAEAWQQGEEVLQVSTA